MSDQATLSKPPTPRDQLESGKTNILNALHRCDKCSAAAYVRVPFKVSKKLPKGGYLQFCGHHYDEYEMALIPYVDGKVIDERHKLVQNKLVGTENS